MSCSNENIEWMFFIAGVLSGGFGVLGIVLIIMGVRK